MEVFRNVTGTKRGNISSATLSLLRVLTWRQWAILITESFSVSETPKPPFSFHVVDQLEALVLNQVSTLFGRPPPSLPRSLADVAREKSPPLHQYRLLLFSEKNVWRNLNRTLEVGEGVASGDFMYLSNDFFLSVLTKLVRL